MSTYARERRKMFRGLADHCHDKAIEALTPATAAQWMALADAALWATDPEGEAEPIQKLAKEFRS